MTVLTIGIPKGSLEETTLALFARVGLVFSGSERSLWLRSSDAEIRPVLLRPQEIPSYVAAGSLDCGFAGLDWVKETRTEDSIKVVADLAYSKQTLRPLRWVLAVDEDSPFQKVSDLRQTDGVLKRISTELTFVTESWLAEQGVVAEVDFSWGATEAKVPEFADAIVEIVETGSSLIANGLRIIDTVFQSSTAFLAGQDVWHEGGWKRQKIEGVAVLLESALRAEEAALLHVTVPPTCLAAVEALLPPSANPHQLAAGEGGVLFQMVADKDELTRLIPALERAGALSVSVTSLSLQFDAR